MSNVDATDRGDNSGDLEPPSLLTIILDTHPHAWALLEDTLPLSSALANLLIFINAHLAINHANRVAVIASHSERAQWLYPTPETRRAEQKAEQNGSNDQDVDMQDADELPIRPPDDANKYRPFAQLEHALLHNLRRLMATTTTKEITTSPATLMAGALTLALTYISKQTLLQPGATTNDRFTSDPTNLAGSNDLTTDPNATHGALGLTSRILILSVSGDLADKYIEIMNAIFACQRLSIPIDVLKLSGDPVFLQQAADTTGGIYTSLPDATSRAGFLQYLMYAYLPDQTARRHLVFPSKGEEGVDFRAACFCHKRIVDVGYVCSICLSIFCEPLVESGGECLLCGSRLSMGNYGQRPVVVARKKKKKKRILDSGGGGGETPGSGAQTPMEV